MSKCQIQILCLYVDGVASGFTAKGYMTHFLYEYLPVFMVRFVNGNKKRNDGHCKDVGGARLIVVFCDRRSIAKRLKQRTERKQK